MSQYTRYKDSTGSRSIGDTQTHTNAAGLKCRDRVVDGYYYKDKELAVGGFSAAEGVGWENVFSSNLEDARWSAYWEAHSIGWWYKKPLVGLTIPDNSGNGNNASIAVSGVFVGTGNNNEGRYKAGSNIISFNNSTDVFEWEFELDRTVGTTGFYSGFTQHNETAKTRIYFNDIGQMICRGANNAGTGVVSGVLGTGNHIYILKITGGKLNIWKDGTQIKTDLDVSGASEWLLGDLFGSSAGSTYSPYTNFKLNYSKVTLNGTLFAHWLFRKNLKYAYDISGNGRHVPMVNGAAANFTTVTCLSDSLALHGCTKVTKSDASDFCYVPYTTAGVPIYDHATPIWDANETYKEYPQLGYNAIVGTYIRLPEDADVIAAANAVTLQNWFDVGDNANDILVDDLIPYEEKKQYFNVNANKELVIIKV